MQVLGHLKGWCDDETTRNDTPNFSNKDAKIYWVGVEWGNNGLLSHRRNAEPVRFRPTQL